MSRQADTLHLPLVVSNTRLVWKAQLNMFPILRSVTIFFFWGKTIHQTFTRARSHSLQYNSGTLDSNLKSPWKSAYAATSWANAPLSFWIVLTQLVSKSFMKVFMSSVIGKASDLLTIADWIEKIAAVTFQDWWFSICSLIGTILLHATDEQATLIQTFRPMRKKNGIQ